MILTVISFNCHENRHVQKIFFFSTCLLGSILIFQPLQAKFELISIKQEIPKDFYKSVQRV